ncbi:unnamed protein product [Peniophora sp. CBMAI 1063]|nr:unnamed protein product [Peniophora sp. CBMAI 1063]
MIRRSSRKSKPDEVAQVSDVADTSVPKTKKKEKAPPSRKLKNGHVPYEDKLPPTKSSDLPPRRKRPAKDAEDANMDSDSRLTPLPEDMVKDNCITADTSDEENGGDYQPDAKDNEDSDVSVELNEFENVNSNPKATGTSGKPIVRTKKYQLIETMLNAVKTTKTAITSVLRAGAMKKKPCPDPFVSDSDSDSEGMPATISQLAKGKAKATEDVQASSSDSEVITRVPRQPGVPTPRYKVKERAAPEPRKSDKEIVEDSEESSDEEEPPKRKPRKLPESWTASTPTAGKSSGSSKVPVKGQTVPVQLKVKGTPATGSVKESASKRRTKLKAPGAGKKAKRMALNNDSDVEVLGAEELNEMQTAKRHKWMQMKAHEAKQPVSARMIIDPSTLKFAPLSEQKSEVLVNAISEAHAFWYHYYMFFNLHGPLPRAVKGVDVGKAAIAGAALRAVVTVGSHHAEIKERLETDDKFVDIVCKFIHSRKSANHGKYAGIACDMILGLFPALKQVVESKTAIDHRRVMHAITALLHEHAFVWEGTLARVAPSNPEDARMEYRIHADATGNPYFQPGLAEFITKSCFSQDSRGINIDHDLFPDPAFVIEGTENENRKEVPRQLLAFAAAMMELALKEYTGGTYSALTLHEPFLRRLYEYHEKTIRNFDPVQASILLQETYLAAREWEPRVIEEEVPTIVVQNTWEGLIAYFKFSRRCRRGAQPAEAGPSGEQE